MLVCEKYDKERERASEREIERDSVIQSKIILLTENYNFIKHII